MPWDSMENVPENLREHGGAKLTLEQANWLAEVADAVKEQGDADEPWAVAWAQFEEAYEKKGSVWVKRGREEEAEPQARAPDLPALKPYQQRSRVNEVGAEGAVEARGDGDYRVELISHGRTRDGQRYYRNEALAEAANSGLYDGAKMYLNHRLPAVDMARGHRDLHDWVATVKPGSVRFTGTTLEAIAHVHEPTWAAILGDPVARREVGLSQDATVKFYQGAIDGTQAQIIEAIEEVHSVDWVPSGNAWGRVLEAYGETDADAKPEDEEVANMPDLTGLTLEVLESARPDLVAAVTARVQEAEVSLDDKQQALYQAVQVKWGSAPAVAAATEDAWPQEIFDDYLIIRQGQQFYRVTYTTGADGTVTVGDDKTEVRQEWVEVGGAQEVVQTETDRGNANTTDVKEADMAEEQVAQESEDVTAEAPVEEQTETAPEEQAAETTEAAPDADLAAQLSEAKVRIAELEEQVARTAMAEAVREAVAQVTGLTDASKARVTEAVCAGPVLEGEALAARVTEAAEAERAHEVAVAKALGLGTRVRGAGAARPPVLTDEAKAKSAEVREAAGASFKEQAIARGMDAKTAERLAAAR